MELHHRPKAGLKIVAVIIRSILRAKFETLSPREKEVMARVTGGLLNKQIAVELGVSEGSVKVHRGNVMRKMGAEISRRPGEDGGVREQCGTQSNAYTLV